MASSPTTAGRRFAELFAVCGLAFAQPVFDLIARNRELVVIDRVRGPGLVAVTLAVLFVPPAALWLVEQATSRWPRVLAVVHAVLCGLGLGLFAAQLVKSQLDWVGAAMVAAGVVVAVVATVGRAIADGFGAALRLLAFLPVLLAVWMLAFSPLADIAFSAEPSPAAVSVGRPGRVVFIVLDELPLMSLLDGHQAIDAELFPNFAALAATSHWFRNETTVSPYTPTAVPAILTGEFPERDQSVPHVSDHPHNLFTLVGRTYRINSHELVTSLCPSDCGEQTISTMRSTKEFVSDLLSLWTKFAAPSRADRTLAGGRALTGAVTGAEEFIASLRPSRSDRPTLDFAHLALPHQPWHLTAQLQNDEAVGLTPGAADFSWVDAWYAKVARVRHLMQVQAADTVLGRVRARLEELGEWDRTTVVVTADHGVAFTEGNPIRSVSRGNYPEIMWTPLFMKAARQTAPEIHDRPTLSVDVLPTLAEILDVDIPWKIDGRSALSGRERIDRRPLFQFAGDAFEPSDTLRAMPGRDALWFDGRSGFREVLAAAAAPAGGVPALRINRIGPHADLIGHPVTDFDVLDEPADAMLAIPGGRRFGDLDPNARVVPWVYNQALLAGSDTGAALAVAVNGQIVFVSEAKAFNRSAASAVVFIVPPAVTHTGPNPVRAYFVEDTAGAVALRPVAIALGA